MANNYYMSLLEAMDHLWFHQIILLSQPFSLIASRSLETPQPVLSTDSFKDSISSLEDEKDEKLSTDFSTTTDDSSESSPKTPQDYKEQPIDKKPKMKRSSFTNSRRRSHSSSPLRKKCPENLRLSGATSTTRLEKSMSCRSLGELELREVKGFMDLGFIFKKEDLSPRMMSVIPGLQRLKVCKSKENDSENYKGEDDQGKEERGVTRPYLSEAWLIKRPGSPLLNLRVPRFSADADMKKHLRLWARIVASEIQHE